MMSSKQAILQLYPTARAVKNSTGYALDGVHDAFKVEATTEEKLWDEAVRVEKNSPGAHMRYCVMLNHLRWIEQRKQENARCT
jgi:hypothetical protein